MDEEHPLIKDAYQTAKERLGARKMKEYQELLFHHTLNVYFNVLTYSKDLDVRIAAMFRVLLTENLTGHAEVARHYGVRAADIAVETLDNQNRMSEMGYVEYYIDKFNTRSREALLIELCALADRVQLLNKLNPEFLKQDPFYPARTVENSRKILLGLDERKLYPEHHMVIDKLKNDLDEFSKNFQ